MSNKYGSKWIRPEKRRAIYARDNFSCTYCGATDLPLSLDHVKPREDGGTHDATNLVTACVSCNSIKQDFGNRHFFELLRERGIDTSDISKRIRARTRRPIDINHGKLLLRHAG